uniref:Reverse transcriptase domain-containing protein n=1 Tax=Tanacetum cinerariifolium TaxID=118510 RepID=A0A699GLN0_TANCI|nr:reverse transcriptase domain-containing protein [Tanacetum cinerariifolium]
MTSFGYHLNPRYAIKECSSCGALYTRDFCCSKGNVEDKILVPKLPKNYARCGHPVDGPYSQGCALLRKKLEEDLVKYFQYFQNTSESSDDSTNIVNAPREPFVVKQDHDIPICCDDDDDYNSAITPNEPVLSTEEPDNSLSMGDEHLDTIPITESDEVIKSSVEDLVSIPTKDHFEIVINSNDDYSSSDDDSLYNENIEYVEASPHIFELVSLEVAEIVISEDEEIKDDNLHEKLFNINLLIAKIEALKDNLTPSSEFLTKSSFTSPKSFLEETNTFDNSLPEFENFCFDLEEISSGKISSGSTTTHSDISLYEYDSFIFDLSNDQFPPTDRSNFTHEEFADELAHIISPPEKVKTLAKGFCTQVFISSASYWESQKTKKIHDSKIKDRVFNVGDQVILFNSCLKIFLGKLKTRWTGPFTVAHVFPYGTIELSQADGPNFKDCPDLEVSHARGFVHRPLELQSLAHGNPIS